MPRRDPFGHRDDIGDIVVLQTLEPPTGPADARDDLVHDEDDVVFIANLANARHVPLGRRYDAPGGDGLLADVAGDRRGVLQLDELPQLVRVALRRRLVIVAVAIAIAVGRIDVIKAPGQRLEVLSPGRNGAGGEGGKAHPVVVVAAPDDLVLAPVAHHLVVLPRHLDGRFVRVRTVAGEHRVLKRARGERREFFRQTDLGYGGGPTARVLHEIGHLLDHRLNDDGVVEAERRGEGGRGGVQVLPAVDIGDHGTAALGDDRGRGVKEGWVIPKRRPQVCLGGLSQVGGVQFRHAKPLRLGWAHPRCALNRCQT